MLKRNPRLFQIKNHKGNLQIDLDRIVADYCQLDAWLLYRFIKKHFRTKITQRIRNVTEVLWFLNADGQRINIYQDWTGINISAEDQHGENVLLKIIEQFQLNKKFIEHKKI